MATSYTSLLGLALPVTAELDGTWGDVVNNSITALLDTAVAGTTTLSTDADVTLTTTTGASNQARQAIILCSGSRSALRTITAPAQSKIYVVINNTTGGFGVKLVGAGPTTGVTVANGKTAVLVWNGSDFVEVAPATATTATNLAGGSAGSLPYQSGAGATTFLSIGTNNFVLTSNGTAPVWTTNTGTGNVVRATSPTLTTPTISTSATVPLLIGGTGTTSTLTLRSTSGVGTTGADIIFQTGNNGATEAMRILNSGNVGVGTASPSAALHVAAGVTNAEFTRLGVAAFPERALRLSTFTNGGYTNTGILFNAPGATGFESSTPALAFATGSTERMRIDSSGNLGVGTTSPTSKLTVDGTFNVTGNATLGDASTDTVQVNGYMGIGAAASTDSKLLIVGPAISGTNQYGLQVRASGTSGATGSVRAIYARADTEAASFTTSAAAAFWAADAIKGAGSTITNQHGINITDQTQGTNNFGITSLVSSGANKWNIYASGTADNYLRGKLFVNSTLTTGSSLASTGEIKVEGDLFHGMTAVAHNDVDGNIPFFQLLRSLGTGAAPTAVTSTTWLGVVNWAGYDGVNAAYRTAAQIRGFVDGAVSSGVVPGAISFWLANTSGTNAERMRIDSSGNVGIGTTTPNTRLTVAASGSTPTEILRTTSTASLATYLALQAYNASSAAVTYASLGSIIEANTAGSHSGAFVINTVSAAAAAERMRITSAGNVGIGTTAPVNKLQINGSLGRNAPVTKTGNFTLADTENWVICNGTGTITVTLPAASSWTGREVMIKTIAAFTVVSASSNVVPLAGGAAGTAILAASAGAWATLVSDGTNWIIMQA